jgi:hypothetical protein
MDLQKRKRGIAFLGEHTVKIVIAAICILFLVILAVKLYYMVKSDSDLEKAKKSMAVLEEQIVNLLGSKTFNTAPVVLFPPQNWLLKVFGYGNFYRRPSGDCAGSYACLCMCKEDTCDGLRVCKGFGKEVRIAIKDGYSIRMFRDVVELELIYAKDKYYETDKLLIRWLPERNPQSGCNNGEVRNANGVCECDSANGWTSFSNPWRSQEPPCQWDKSEDRKVLDKSLEVTEANKNDKGVCIHYYTVRYYSNLVKEPKMNLVYEELSRYPRSNGYIQKVDKLAMNSNLKYFDKSQVMARENCYKMQGTMSTYAIFYTSYDDGNTVYTGNTDDLGYCAKFPADSSAGEIIVEDGEMKREECIQIADAEKGYYEVSFFTEKMGAKMYVPIKPLKQEISLKYSSDFDAKIRGADLILEEVKSKCPDYEKYEVTFIKGALNSAGVYMGGKQSSSRLAFVKDACANEIKYLFDNKLIDKKYYASPGHAKEIGDNKNVCCYAY